jgi:hypothetical protein
MRKKPNYRRRRTVAVVGLLVLVVVVLLVLPRGGGTGRPKGQTTPILSFAATHKNITQGKKLPDAGTVSGNQDQLTKMFNDFYQTAFIDPQKWGDGTFGKLRDLFAKAAQASFTKDLTSLTIGEARTELRFVDPMPSTLVVTVYYDKNAKPTFAVAAADFNGRGTPKTTGPAVLIHAKATFYMQRAGNDWTITYYDAKQTQESVSPSPSPSASR